MSNTCLNAFPRRVRPPFLSLDGLVGRRQGGHCWVAKDSIVVLIHYLLFNLHTVEVSGPSQIGRHSSMCWRSCVRSIVKIGCPSLHSTAWLPLDHFFHGYEMPHQSNICSFLSLGQQAELFLSLQLRPKLTTDCFQMIQEPFSLHGSQT